MLMQVPVLSRESRCITAAGAGWGTISGHNWPWAALRMLCSKGDAGA
jgi:hypothetical protein